MKKSGVLIEKTEIIFTPEVLEKVKKQTQKAGFEKIKTLIKSVRLFHILYQSGDHRVHGYLAMPKRVRGKQPCIIANRGGMGDFGSYTLAKAVLRLGRIAEWGYIAIGSQYSGCGGSEGQEDFGGSGTLADVINCQKVLTELSEADVARIGMYGSSRGGMMTYLALAKVKWIKAAVTVAGIADVERNLRMRLDLKKYIQKLTNYTTAEMQQRSAIHWPEKFPKKTPVLLMHGTGDWRVSVLDSLDLTQKLYENKRPCRLIVFEGGDHRLSEHLEEKDRQMRLWFDCFVRDGEVLPNLKLHGD